MLRITFNKFGDEMKKTLFILIFIAIQTISNAQVSGTTFSGTPADIIIDARSIALGESLVANPVSINAFQSNPANLSKAAGVSVFYNRRSFNWLSSDDSGLYYYSAGAVVPLSIGNFSFSYSKFIVDFNNSNSFFNSAGEQYYSTIGISYSRAIAGNLLGGISVKFLDFNSDVRGEGNRYQTINERPVTPLFDFGILYSISGPFIKNDSRSSDNIHLGLSVSNIGTKAKYSNEFNGAIHSSGESPVIQYFRLGFSYNFNFFSEEHNPLFSVTLSGEYRNQMNPQEYERNLTDNFGVGMEAGLFDMVYLRIGGIARNGNSILYKNGELRTNYGFGISLPASLLIENLPLKLGFDYAVTTQEMGDAMPAFNLNLNYGIKLF